MSKMDPEPALLEPKQVRARESLQLLIFMLPVEQRHRK